MVAMLCDVIVTSRKEWHRPNRSGSSFLAGIDNVTDRIDLTPNSPDVPEAANSLYITDIAGSDNMHSHAERALAMEI